jgi:hypothetical protein
MSQRPLAAERSGSGLDLDGEHLGSRVFPAFFMHPQIEIG